VPATLLTDSGLVGATWQRAPAPALAICLQGLGLVAAKRLTLPYQLLAMLLLLQRHRLGMPSPLALMALAPQYTDLEQAWGTLLQAQVYLPDIISAAKLTKSRLLHGIKAFA
jgi:predicted cobalt transporter CbtA